MKQIAFAKFLDALSIGNRPEIRKQDQDILAQLEGIQSGHFFPNAEIVEGYINGPIETIRPFIFNSPSKPVDEHDFVPEPNLSLPFPAVWIELLHEPLLSKQKDVYVEKRGSQFRYDIDFGAQMDRTIKPGSRARGKVDISTVGALVIEPSQPDEPYRIVFYDEYIFIGMNEGDPDGKLEKLFRSRFPGRTLEINVMSGIMHYSIGHAHNGDEGRLYQLVQSLFHTMRSKSSQVGTATINERVKIGAGDNRRLHKIKDIVVVTPKKYQSQLAEAMATSKEIDWSHRWDVMGHWRKVNSIGKDRSGSYTIKGYTWVVPHVKGPEDMPLIQKTRLINETEPDTE